MKEITKEERTLLEVTASSGCNGSHFCVALAKLLINDDHLSDEEGDAIRDALQNEKGAIYADRNAALRKLIGAPEEVPPPPIPSPDEAADAEFAALEAKLADLHDRVEAQAKDLDELHSDLAAGMKREAAQAARIAELEAKLVEASPKLAAKEEPAKPEETKPVI